jgi:hypothetical protein
MDDALNRLPRRTEIGIIPTITRSAEGRVERQRVVMVIDVVPEGNDYRLDVVTETIPPSLISKKHPILNP